MVNIEMDSAYICTLFIFPFNTMNLKGIYFNLDIPSLVLDKLMLVLQTKVNIFLLVIFR